MDFLTQRDWFAGQCLPALIAGYLDDTTGQQLTSAQIAQVAYAVADAMLVERAK